MPWTLVGNLTPCTPDWEYVPPTDHLPLPVVNVGDQKLVGSFAVFPQDGANFVALSAAGAYTVNWGDGTTEDFATGVQANHAYTYASTPSGTLTVGGYRQVVITVTPQAGQTLTAINLGRRHPQLGSTNVGGTGWLDICIAGASISSLQLAATTTNVTVVLLSMLERFEYKGPSALTNLPYLFSKCYALQSIKGSQWTGNVTNIGNWLSGCNSLTALVDMDLSKVTTTTNAFAGLASLQQVSGLNLSSVATGSSLFENSVALREVADLNLSKVGLASSMFAGCTALRSVSNIDFSLATGFNSLFSGCTSLQSVAGLISPKVSSFITMFTQCASLRTVELFDTSSGLTFNGMFTNCANLQAVPAFDTSKGTTFTNTFNGCSSLTALPALNMAAATNVGSLAINCPSLVSVGIVGLKVTCDFTNCRLSSAALDTLYTNLGTAATQTITVTGNYGTTGDTPSIATAKGWTVTGS